MNHKWKDNICVHCGIKREMKTWKLLMAMVGSRDYYQYGRQYYYTVNGVKKGTFKRPECQLPEPPK